MAKHNEIGKVGENIAAQWLIEKGFVIIERNYLRKWGEIDIVARETTDMVHFVEVKSVSYETKRDLNRAVSHETWRPEENVHSDKQRRLGRAIQSWIAENSLSWNWQIDVIVLRVVPREKYCKVLFLENIIFDN